MPECPLSTRNVTSRRLRFAAQMLRGADQHSIKNHVDAPPPQKFKL
jgi:hypothetical protein